MTETQRLSGVLAPVLTPFDDDLEPDVDRFIAHCKWLISRNCGLAVFGTTSEGNSLSVEEKIALLDALIAEGLDVVRVMVGTGCCALTDTVRLTNHAVASGCAGVLMLPPFYYKGVSEEGIFAAYSEVIERVGDPRLKIYLYHIPQVTGVGIPAAAIERLLKRHPQVIAGIKDSAGDWEHTKMLLNRFKEADFDVFVGSESLLLSNMRNGGAGCISATANVNPAAIDRLFRHWNEPDAEQQQAALTDVRQILSTHGMIPSLKAVIAHFAGHPNWMVVRPPLDQLATEQSEHIIDQLLALGFAMPR